MIRNGDRERAEENPLLLANRKARKLKSLLGRTKAFKSFAVPLSRRRSSSGAVLLLMAYYALIGIFSR